MSRIGKAPIALPNGVAIEQKNGEIHVKGPHGQLRERMPEGISLEVAGGEARFTRADDRKPTCARHGLARALTANMVKGVTDGFSKDLTIIGVGYRAEVAGKVLKLNVGYSNPVEMAVPEGLKVSIEKNTEVRIEGISRHAVGQFAAEIRGVRPPEPYKGKGIRYADEHVRRKVGKTGAA